MTESQLDIFAEIAPAEIADYHPGSPWRSASWSVQYHEMVIDPSGFCTVKLMAAWTGQHWVGGFLMVAYQEDKLLYVLEIMPGAVIIQPGVTLPIRKEPITAPVRPAVMADAAHALAHAMTGYPLYARPVPAPAVAFNISDNVDANTSSAERIDDNSSAPAVAVPAVQDDCVSQDESTMMMAASALVLYRAGESAEYMAKAIEALLQSNGCSSQTQNEVRYD